MKRTIYLLAGLILNIVIAVIFWDRINVASASLVPLFALAVSAFDAAAFLLHPGDAALINSHIRDLTSFTDAERVHLSRSLADALTAFMPFYPPFIIFFGTFVKIVVPTLLLIASFAAGPFIFRIRCGDGIKARMDAERAELEEQKKKEELGRYK